MTLAALALLSESYPVIRSGSDSHRATETSPLLPKHEDHDHDHITISKPTPTSFKSPLTNVQALSYMIGVFITAMDTTVNLTIYESIASDYSQLFNANWIPIVYFLFSFSFFPLHHQLLRKYGARSAFVIALSIFTLGALCMVLSSSHYPQLPVPGFILVLISRGIMGIGAGFVLSIGPIVLCSHSLKSVWTSNLKLYFSAALTLGSMLGAPLGGYFAVFYSWRCAFWLECLMAFCLLCACLVTHSSQQPQPQTKTSQTINKDSKDSISYAILQSSSLSILLLLFAYLFDKITTTTTTDSSSSSSEGTPLHDSLLLIILLLSLLSTLQIYKQITYGTFLVFVSCMITSAGAYHISLFQQTVFLKPAHLAGAWLTPAMLGAFLGGVLAPSPSPAPQSQSQSRSQQGTTGKSGTMVVPASVVGALIQVFGTVVALLHVGVVKKQLEGLVSGWVLTNIGNAIILAGISMPPQLREGGHKGVDDDTHNRNGLVSLAGARTLGSLFGVILGFAMSKWTILEYVPLNKLPVSLEIIRLPEQFRAVDAYEMGVRGTITCDIGLACFILLFLVMREVRSRGRLGETARKLRSSRTTDV